VLHPESDLCPARFEGLQRRDASQRSRFRDALVDIAMSQTVALGEMSLLLETLQDDRGTGSTDWR